MKSAVFRNARGQVATRGHVLREARVDWPVFLEILGQPELDGERRGRCCGHMEGVHEIGDGACIVPGCNCLAFLPEAP